MDGKLGCLAVLEAKILRKDIHELHFRSSCSSEGIMSKERRFGETFRSPLRLIV